MYVGCGRLCVVWFALLLCAVCYLWCDVCCAMIAVRCVLSVVLGTVFVVCCSFGVDVCIALC